MKRNIEAKGKNAWRALLLMSVGCFLAGCGSVRPSDPQSAIRQAIEEHLAGRTGLASDKIVMDLKQVQVKGDKAEADVVFRSRSDPKATMAFHYQLHTEGNQWKVDTGRPSGDTSPHPPSPPSPDAAPSVTEGHPSLPPVPK